jgi:hypothetical protein
LWDLPQVIGIWVGYVDQSLGVEDGVYHEGKFEPTRSTRLPFPLFLDFLVSEKEEDGVPFTSLECYATLDTVFHNCREIRILDVGRFDFGNYTAAISPTIKEGFGRLIELDLNRSGGNIPMFIQNTPIPNPQTPNYETMV